MKQGRTDRDWAVVALMTFGAGVVVTWALTSPHPPLPKLTAEQWAAWVQAIGSIIAILIAIAIPAVQHKLASRREEAATLNKARSLGLFIRPAIEEFGRTLDAVWDNEDPEEFEAIGWVVDTNQCCLGGYAYSALQIPKALISSLATLHELGPAAAGILRAIHCVQSAKELTTKGSSGGPVIYDMELFYDHLWDATKGVTNSLNAIDAFFPRRKRK